MKVLYPSFLFVAILLMVAACDSNSTARTGGEGSISSEDSTSNIQKTTWEAPLVQLSDVEYPDNPDISIRHSKYDEIAYEKAVFDKTGAQTYSITCRAKGDLPPNLIFKDINIMEWIPMAPEWVQSDDYATYIGLINQEWNRHQVRFDTGMFVMEGGTPDKLPEFTRVDIARNCLNAYLWEIIVYAEEDGKSKPYYHGWFDFPKDLYAELFNQRNPNLDYETFRAPLENWVDPENKPLDLSLLRTVNQSYPVPFIAHNNAFYPLIGERKKKNINIIHPKEAATIDAFLSDQTLYATFTPPGFYNTKDPRKTELSRFGALKKMIVHQTTGKNPSQTKAIELELHFERNTDGSLMKMVIGGIDPAMIPQKSLEELHKGWQMPMGIANHSFYETYDFQQNYPSSDNPYFAVLLDEKGNWLDSHKVGIDGPLFHRDADNPNIIHLWVLSFERHSFVGHFSFLLGNVG